MFDFKESVANSTLKKRTQRVSHVFNQFPESPELFAPEIDVQEIIRRHGPAEWRAAVLTNELHGHLGIYAVIGVKMGTYALELLGTGTDDISVTSYAGSQPPVSCMNDGLQVSTGATVGHGLFRTADCREPRPEAVFHFWNRSVGLCLAPEYSARIRENVLEGIRLHGIHSEAYWEHIRRLAIRYWLEMDRRQIFEQL